MHRLLVLLLVLVGCGNTVIVEGGAPDDDGFVAGVDCGDKSGVDLSGVWAGTWNSDNGLSGEWETSWQQDESGGLRGMAVVSGTPTCGSSAEVEGDLDDACDVTFGLVRFGGCAVDFSGAVDESGDAMSGSFTVTAGVNDAGRWQGVRR